MGRGRGQTTVWGVAAVEGVHRDRGVDASILGANEVGAVATSGFRRGRQRNVGLLLVLQMLLLLLLLLLLGD